MTEQQAFSARLRMAMGWRGVSGLQLAAQIGVTPQAVSKFAHGKMLPASSVLVKIGKALDTSLDFLMGGDDLAAQVEDVLHALPPRLTDRQAQTGEYQ